MHTDYHPAPPPPTPALQLSPGFWLAISTSPFPPTSRNRRGIQKKGGKHLCSALQSGVELARASISPQTVFSFHLFVELCLCTAVREQRNHKDMHKLSHKKEGGKKNFTSEAIHNWRFSLFRASVIRKLYLSQCRCTVGEGGTGANSEFNFWWQMTRRSSGASEGLWNMC